MVRNIATRYARNQAELVERKQQRDPTVSSTRYNSVYLAQPVFLLRLFILRRIT